MMTVTVAQLLIDVRRKSYGLHLQEKILGDA
jgi:hypothetical protein